jgi:hypothetical protein
MFADEMLDQQPNILRAFTKSGNPDIDYVETMVEVFAEGFSSHHLVKRAIGSGDDPNIHGHFCVFANRQHALLLQYAQHFCLQANLKFSHFVEKQRSTIRTPDQPLAVVLRTGEGASAMTEELAFDQMRAYGSTVDANKGSATALRIELVQSMRE